MELQDMLKFNSENQEDWLLRTMFAGTMDTGINTDNVYSMIPEISNNYPNKPLEIRANVKEPML